MGTGISIVALPQWYREWGLKYGKRGFIAASQAVTWDTSQVSHRSRTQQYLNLNNSPSLLPSSLPCSVARSLSL